MEEGGKGGHKTLVMVEKKVRSLRILLLYPKKEELYDKIQITVEGFLILVSTEKNTV